MKYVVWPPSIHIDSRDTLQLNCHDLVGESDTAAEGILRARFEQAMSCTPCLLIARHVDAFGMINQPSEQLKGWFQM